MVALVGMGLLSLPAFGAEPARPGTLNYVEGTAYLGGKLLNDRDVGSTDLDAGQVLSTGQGKAEMLLTPGIYLRLDDNSAVKMVSPDLAMTNVDLERGEAGVEVDEIYKQNNVRVTDDGVPTQLLKPGFYEFNADGTERTFKGEAAVDEGDGKYRMVKSHHEFQLSELDTARPLDKEKPVGFDAGAAQDNLYNWSSLRSQYLAEANNQIASEYGGSGFYPGWFWDPWMWDYTFIGPGPFWSPFGFGYYPFGWGGWYGGFYGRGLYGHPRIGGIGRGGFYGGGGFHGGFGGGGFHGGGGGGRR
jgi:hypothetical protein